MMQHLLGCEDLDRTTAIQILDTALELSQRHAAGERKLDLLRGRIITNLFYEDSTRTRLSFDAAAKRLGADVVTFTAKGSSVSKGESLVDTALTLQAMGMDAALVRHSAAGAPHRLARVLDCAVVNAGDGAHQHPTQALLDAFTIRARLHGTGQLGADLTGVRVGIVGDILHSRVAHSNAILLVTLGARVSVIAPPTLLPRRLPWNVTGHHDLDEVLPELDVCMPLRVQAERMNSAYFPSAAEYVRQWGLDAARAARLPDHAIVMTPGPTVRGMEISSEVADSPRSTIVEQVANGVSVRAAVLHLLLNGEQFVPQPTAFGNVSHLAMSS
jgi:aspartate carbamoyltransferase catalytic subunit